MELNLQRVTLEGYQPILDTVLTQEETMENIVPDAFPDVSRIVSAGGNAFLTAKQAGEGFAKFVGTARISVLYVPEGEQAPRALTFDMPFQCAGDCPHINGGTQLHGAVLSLCADARLINPRKLFVKAEVKIRLKAYNRENREVACDLLAADNHALQKQMRQHKDFAIAAALEKSFLFSDTLRQSPSKPTMEELLSCHAEPGKVEAKYIGKKLVCKGEMLLTALYRSGSEVISARFELPFSQILDLDGSCDEGEPDVMAVLKSVDCHLRDGELDVAVEALLQATLWSQRIISLLSDAYSTSFPLDTERSMTPINTMSEQNSKRETARKFCETGIPAKQVINCTVSLSPLNIQKQEGGVLCSADANVDILYLSEDDALCSVNYAVPVSGNLELPDGCTCSCDCRLPGEIMAVPVTGGFEVRLEVEFTWRTVKTEMMPCVSAVKQGAITAEGEQRPSVIIRMVGSGETMWDVAKSCGSTIQDICAANDFASEVVSPGTVLLIPTKR